MEKKKCRIDADMFSESPHGFRMLLKSNGFRILQGLESAPGKPNRRLPYFPQ